MAVSTDVNDPSFGLETDQSSPNFGLASEPPKQESIVGNALAGAGDVIKGFAQQFVPKFDLKTLAGLAYGPVNAQIQGYNAIKSIGDTAAQVQESEKTPAFSRERFGAGLNVVGQLGLLALGGREKPLSEIALGKTPEVAPEAMPQTPEPLAAEVAAKEPIIPEPKPEEVTQEPAPAQAQPEAVQQAGEATPIAHDTPSEFIEPKSVNLTDPNTPIEHRGPTLALKLDDGTVVYASDVRLHSQLLDKAGVDPERVVDSGVYRGDQGFESHAPDTVDIHPENAKPASTQEAQPPTTAAIKPEEAAVPQPEQSSPIVAAATKMPDGNVFTGLTHGHAMNEIRANYGGDVPDGYELGYVDRNGTFLNKQEALDRATANRQIPKVEAEKMLQEQKDAGISEKSRGLEAIKFNELRRDVTPSPEAEGATTAEPLPKEAPTEAVPGTQAEIAQAREARGIDPYERQLRQSWGEAVDKADARFAQEPEYGENLAREISDTPRAANPEEHVALLRNWRAKETAYDRAIKAGDQDALDIARQGAEEAYDALDKSGTAGGRLLAARKMIVDEFYTPKRMRSEMESAGMGKKLSKAEEAQVDKVHEEFQTAKSEMTEKEGQRMADRGMAEKLSERIKKHNADLDKMAAEAREGIIKDRGSLKWEEDFSPCVL